MRRTCLIVMGWTLGWLTMTAMAADPMDWPMWRGPEQNGISREKGLVDKWSPAGENLLWHDPDLAGRSTPIVMRGKLYVVVRDQPGTPREGEKVVCVDAATGKKIWETRWNVFLSDVPDTRVGWSSVAGDPETGHVFALGVNGYLTALDGETGKILWSHSMSEEYGLLSTYGGRTNFPIVFEDLVIVNAVMIGWGEFARPNHRYIGFDKKTGEPVWIAATRPLPDDTTYSTPITAVMGGEWGMVFGCGDGGIYCLQPRTGKERWKFKFSLRGVNVTPVIDGNAVYVCHSEENLDDTSMGSVASLNGDSTGELSKGKGVNWKFNERLIGKVVPLLIDGKLYTIDDGAGLFVFDAKTGKQIFKKKLGTMQRASPLYADGKIYTCDATGRWAVLRPTAKGVDVVHQLKLPGESPEVHASPIVSHGRIYVSSTSDFYCIGKKDHTPSADPIPPHPSEEPVEKDQTPAQLLIVPCEVLLHPGETKKFEARLYNAKGQFLKTTPAQFSVDKAGAIDSDGTYTAASDAKHQASIITASVGGLKGMARVRVVPPLPWSFDFSDGEVPIPWIGARYRHVVRDVNGEKVMVKVTTIPKGTRSQAWMGQTDLRDYTIQADVLGNIKDNKLPDIGLIAQRYTLDMMGESQKLQIRTWPPVLDNLSKDVPFSWKPGVWHTMKFKAAIEDGKAVLRGKVWPRDSEEPKDWTIEYSYEVPNTNGSPGLYGNATNAEIFLDNIKVTPNAN